MIKKKTKNFPQEWDLASGKRISVKSFAEKMKISIYLNKNVPDPASFSALLTLNVSSQD